MVSDRTAAEFFSGIGLVRLALDQCGWRSLFSNDNDLEKCRMYRQNFSDADQLLIDSDIKDIAGDDIPDVTLATASFPCNDLSLAGSGNGIDGAQSGSFWQFIRILEEMGWRKPPLVLLENVTGFLTCHDGSDFQRAMRALNRLGYACDPFMVNASNFVPQSRLRLFVVASLITDTTEDSPQLIPVESEVRPRILARFIFEHPEIMWSLRRLSRLPQSSSRLGDILEDLPSSSEYWWSADRVHYLLNQMSDKHRKIADAMVLPDQIGYGTIFRRVRQGRSMAELRTDGIAGCLRTPRGGSGRQILLAAGKGAYGARLLTPRECARLQGVPDSYLINVPLNRALFGFGDAVCVPVIRWIAENYLNPVAEKLATSRQQKMVAVNE